MSSITENVFLLLCRRVSAIPVPAGGNCHHSGKQCLHSVCGILDEMLRVTTSIYIVHIFVDWCVETPFPSRKNTDFIRCFKPARPKALGNSKVVNKISGVLVVEYGVTG